MIHFNCPKCTARLRVPENPRPKTIKCPLCNQVFDTPAASADGSDEAGEVTGRLPGKPGDTADAAGEVLSAADEALLRELGSGSGLLELTREAYGDPQMDARSGAAFPAGPGALSPERAGPNEIAEPGERQFQIVATALMLANKLVEAHKAESSRVRKNARLAWAIVPAIALVAVAGLWWGMSQSNSANVARARLDNERSNVASVTKDLNNTEKRLTDKVTDAQTQLTDEKAKAAKLAGDLATATTEAQRLKTELDLTRDSLTDAKSSAKVFAAQLEATNARIGQLTAELEMAKAQLKPTTQTASK